MELFTDAVCGFLGGSAVVSVGVYESFRTFRLYLILRLVPKNSRFSVMSGRQAIVVFGPLKSPPE